MEVDVVVTVLVSTIVVGTDSVDVSVMVKLAIGYTCSVALHTVKTTHDTHLSTVVSGTVAVSSTVVVVVVLNSSVVVAVSVSVSVLQMHRPRQSIFHLTEKTVIFHSHLEKVAVVDVRSVSVETVFVVVDTAV